MKSINLRRFFLVVLAYLLIVIVLSILASCNPAKNISKSMDAADKIYELKQKFEKERQQIASKAIEDYIKANPLNCPPFEINLDSLCPPQNQTATNGTANDYEPITGQNKSGVINGSTRPNKIVYKPYEDVRRINLLTDSLNAYKLLLVSSNAANSANQLSYNVEVSNLESKITKYLWIIIGLCVIGLLLVVIIVKKR